jgi:hypothetical protein
VGLVESGGMLGHRIASLVHAGLRLSNLVAFSAKKNGETGQSICWWFWDN